MMMQLSVDAVSDSAVQSTSFGGNFLFNRDTLDQGTGDFADLTDALGVNSVRYPGGAITEFMFDIENPDSTVGYDISGNEHELIGISDFLSFASSEGKSVTIVLPTRGFLGTTTDLNGNRFARLDQDVLRDFITDVETGVYGDVEIDAFEIGNEYWGSGGMTSVEYGRLASRMASIIDDTLVSDDIDIVVQAGTNFNFSQLDGRYEQFDNADDIIIQLEKDYGVQLSDNVLRSDGSIGWTAVNNELLLDKFDRPEEIAAIDGVSHHLYTRSHAPREEPEFALNTIEQYWEPHFPGIKTYITEYNQKSSTDSFDDEDYGLKNAHELLNVVEDMTAHGVDQAHVWPLSQLTDNALSQGFDFEKLSPVGEMFKMMNEELPGLHALQFDSTIGLETEATSADGQLNVHAFANPDKLVLYFASNASTNISYDVDLSGFLTDGQDIDVTVLGVEDGDTPGNKRSDATIQERDSEEVFDDAIVQADLKPHEIMQIVIEQPEWTPELSAALSLSSEDVQDDPFPLPLLPPQLEDATHQDLDDSEDDDDSFDPFEGIDILFALMPLLALVGLI